MKADTQKGIFAVTPEEAGYLIAAEVSVAEDGLDTQTVEDARLVAGDNAKTFALAHAKLLLARRHRKPVSAPALPTGLLTGALVFAAYLLGVGTDRFAAEGAVVNLLSPPLLFILLWQIVLYLGLLFAPLLRRRNRPAPFPGRALFAEATARLQLPSLTKTGARIRARWLPLLMPSLQADAARAFHLAAAALGFGLLTGLAVRGICTAYTVGWTSTWLASHESLLATILSATYGLVPLDLFGVPFPDAAALAKLNLRVHPEGSPDPAAWLLRLMGLVVGIVILPRLLLAYLSHRKARRLRSSLLWTSAESVPAATGASPAPKTEAHAAAGTSSAETMTPMPSHRPPEGMLLLASAPLTEPLRRATALVLETPCWTERTFDVWRDAPENGLAQFDDLTPERVVLLWDAATTPEDDVHGAWLSALSERFGDRVEILLDFGMPDEPRLATPERLRSRRASWESFAADHRTKIRFLRLQ